MAWAGNPASTAPRRASSHSTATVIDSASTWKNRRAARRVSEKPNPSVPSEVNVARHPAGDLVRHRLDPVRNRHHRPGRTRQRRRHVGHARRLAGCSMFHDSQASASRRSSVHDVADHTSADTPQSVASISWARSASRQRHTGGQDLPRAAPPSPAPERPARRGRRRVQVQPAQDALLQGRLAAGERGGLGRLRVRLVVHGEVVEDVLAVWVLGEALVHPAQRVPHHVGQLVGPRRSHMTRTPR